jgi:hypothetical protein
VLVYALLALVLGGAIAGLVVLLTGPGKAPEASWSAWKPEGDDDQATQQIADHVGSTYHLADGSQLVGVQAAPLRVQDVPIGAIAVRRAPPAGTAQVPVDVLDASSSVVYILCGFGQKCAIDEGVPSTERMRLLRREALELALYTFRYVDGKTTVVAFLPPRPGDDPTYALLFRKEDLEPELARPLRETLPDAVPPPPESISGFEAEAIDRLTAPSLFRYQFQQVQDGTAVLVLDDPSLPPPASSDGGSTQGGQTTQQ